MTETLEFAITDPFQTAVINTPLNKALKSYIHQHQVENARDSDNMLTWGR